MQGVIVTLIADNYFGYSKKEIKSQISYSTNLFGGCEEEHSGGALAFSRAILGEIYLPNEADSNERYSFDQVCRLLGPSIDIKNEGYAIDKTHPALIFIPDTAQINIQKQQISWVLDGHTHTIKLLINHTYI